MAEQPEEIKELSAVMAGMVVGVLEMPAGHIILCYDTGKTVSISVDAEGILKFEQTEFPRC